MIERKKYMDKLLAYKDTEFIKVIDRKNLEMRVMAEGGACEGKLKLAKLAKSLDLDAIHDTVHEMARDEARHGKALKGLLERYFA